MIYPKRLRTLLICGLLAVSDAAIAADGASWRAVAPMPEARTEVSAATDGKAIYVLGGFAGGRGFDRFQALDVGGTGGDVRIAGIRNNAVAADRLTYAKAGLVLPTGPRLRLTLSLDQAWLRSLDDQRTFRVTGLGIAGDLPGFWWFTTVRVDLGVGLLSTLPGVRSCNGFVALLRVF